MMSPSLSCVTVLLLLFLIPSRALDPGVQASVSGDGGRSLVSGLDSVIGAVHSQLRSVFGARKAGLEQLRHQSPSVVGNRNHKLRDDNNLSLGDLNTNTVRRSRVGSGNPSGVRGGNIHRKKNKGRRLKNVRKLPKIFLTKLPVNQLKDPEIFFTKIIKDNESSIEILPSDISQEDIEALADSPSMVYEEVRVYEDADNVIIEETEEQEPVSRSSSIYQEGLRNVNAMIFNSQTVEEKNSRTDKTFPKKVQTSTSSSRFESVSSTARAMVMQEVCTGTGCSGDVTSQPEIEVISVSEITKENIAEAETGRDESDIVSVASQPTPWWREEPWVLPVLILAAATLLLLIVFQVLLFVKSMRGSGLSRCTRLLSQLLLTGLLSCSCVVLLYTLAPTPAVCATIRFGSGISYSVVYSTLLVKLVFLISLNSGVCLSSTYQAVLLFFAVLIQLAIGVQGLVSHPPNLSPTQECPNTFQQDALGQLYNVFLILVVFLLSLKFRSVREHYREAMYICGATSLTCFVWILWFLAGLVLPDYYRDLSSCAASLASTLLTFVVMFLPRGRQLATGQSSKMELYSSEESGPSTVNLSTLSLFSGYQGSLVCCPLTRRTAQPSTDHTAVGSFLNRTFGKPQNTAEVVSSSIDGSIYTTVEDQGLRTQYQDSDRDQYRTGLGGLVVGSENMEVAATEYQRENNYDRFPFMSRPPQFVPGGPPYPLPPPNLYKMDTKTMLKSKPSVTNPNVLFCTPDDMTRTVIY